jgi:transcriptional regulator with XRE-family HTH domain
MRPLDDAGSKGASVDLIELRLAELSNFIRQAREKIGLTLNELSEQSGVAPSTIQKIESRQMIPSIAVILKIAAGLGIDAGELIASRSPPKVEIVVQRTGQYASMNASKKVRYEKLSADIQGAEVECWRIVIGAAYSAKLFRPQLFLEAVIFCERGVIELDIDGEICVLSPGDTVHTRSKTLFGLRNTGDVEAAYILTGRFPHSLHYAFAASMNG